MMDDSYGKSIERHRRHPDSCLYCPTRPTPEEHVLPLGIGGRLTAPILCEIHNHQLGALVDEPMCKEFAPLVNFLAVPRQGGKIGISFTAQTDSGERLQVTSDGRVPQKPLIVQERTATGRIARATGALDRLDSLKAQGALANSGTNHVLAVMSKAPMVRFEIRIDKAVEVGVLKAALHFVAGFVTDVDLDVASSLRDYLLGSERMRGAHVRSSSLDDPHFSDAWPPRHELTAIPSSANIFITVLLFGAYAYNVKLPIQIDAAKSVRYTQILSERFPRFYEDLDVEPVDWDRTPDVRRVRDEAEARVNRMMSESQRRALREQCKEAARCARERSGCTEASQRFWDYYRAELQLQCFAAEEVDRLLADGERLYATGRPVWDI